MSPNPAAQPFPTLQGPILTRLAAHSSQPFFNWSHKVSRPLRSHLDWVLAAPGVLDEAMDARRPPPEYTLELFADINNVRGVARGILHLIFFHRYFPLIRPSTIDVLDLTLPYLAIPELESTIDARCTQLYRQLSTPSTNNSSRSSIQVQFLERKRKNRTASAGLGWFSGAVGGIGGGRGGQEEEVVWETWNVKVTLAAPRTETEKGKAMRAMETTLQRTALKVMAVAGGEKAHIPAITNEAAFPYTITLNPRVEAWGMR